MLLLNAAGGAKCFGNERRWGQSLRRYPRHTSSAIGRSDGADGKGRKMPAAPPHGRCGRSRPEELGGRCDLHAGLLPVERNRLSDGTQRLRQPAGLGHLALGQHGKVGPSSFLTRDGCAPAGPLRHRLHDERPADPPKIILRSRAEPCRHVELKRFRQRVGVQQAGRVFGRAFHPHDVNRVRAETASRSSSVSCVWEMHQAQRSSASAGSRSVHLPRSASKAKEPPQSPSSLSGAASGGGPGTSRRRRCRTPGGRAHA